MELARHSFRVQCPPFWKTKLVADGGLDQLGSIVPRETSGQTVHQAQRGLAVADIHDTYEGHEGFSHICVTPIHESGMHTVKMRA
jgi:hypothetical protein